MFQQGPQHYCISQEAGAEPFTRLRRAVAQVKKINDTFFFNFSTAYVPHFSSLLQFYSKHISHPTFCIFYNKLNVPLFLAIEINYLSSAATLLSTAILIN